MAVAEESRAAAAARRSLEDLRPDVRQLAALAALTVRLQPELLRALRLRCLPRLDVSTEADLWWSSVVSGRGSRGVSISSLVLHRLREELRAWYQRDPQLVGQARELVREYHATESPTVLVEESITWAAVRGDQDTMEKELSRVLRSLVTENRTALVDWWPVAWARLPDSARRTTAAGRLNVATSYLLGPDAITGPVPDGQLIDDSLANALRSVPDTQLGVLRIGRHLELGDVDPERGAAIAVPATPQRLLDLEWQADDGSARTEQVSLPAGTTVREVGQGYVRLRTARGVVFDIPPDTSRVITPARSVVPPRLGALYDGAGTAFTVFSSVASAVTLCLFDSEGNEQQATMTAGAGGLWQCYLAGIGPGQRYGYRVDGPWDPAKGLWANPAKLLLDPYARAIEGQVSWDESVFGYRPDSAVRPSTVDSAPSTPRSVVVDPAFNWGGDRPPRTPYHETVIYEAHVRGLTMRHPDIPVTQQGTYAGLAHPAIIEHLTRLGVTAIELMPVHQFLTGKVLEDRGLRNYWGYNTIGYFAPHNGYSSAGQLGEQVGEFKTMVKTLHEAGIEVILDVVYSFTGEGNQLGPTLSFRGIDNAAYYRLVDDDPQYYMDFTGSGNSFNARHPHSLQLIMDSLRYWATEMHVDGFRFDLAAVLAREFYDVDRLSTFFDLVQQDPVVSQVKLIAEPWDIGEGGYQLGRFPAQWSEWNGKYRDTVRDFWRGQPGLVPELASRLSGSSDLYETSGRRPVASVNFVTCHEGFTLKDLVSYNNKHNEDNDEDNRDGIDDNRSWNCGTEGPTTDPEINELRDRQKRNFLTTLFLSQGVPMLLAGDELGRTQRGNNNAYSQDNEISWVDWSLASASGDLIAFTSALSRLRREHPVFRRRRFFRGRLATADMLGDIEWLTPEGREATDSYWQSEEARALGVFLNGDAISEPDPRGERITDDSFIMIFNAHWEPVRWTLPPGLASSWISVIDTAIATLPGDARAAVGTADEIVVSARSIRVLRAEGPPSMPRSQR